MDPISWIRSDSPSSVWEVPEQSGESPAIPGMFQVSSCILNRNADFDVETVTEEGAIR